MFLHISLGSDSGHVILTGLNEGKYKIMFNDCQVALNVPGDIIDDQGSVEVRPGLHIARSGYIVHGYIIKSCKDQ